jgi:hypothetical protein
MATAFGLPTASGLATLARVYGSRINSDRNNSPKKSKILSKNARHLHRQQTTLITNITKINENN